jgi:hypothetical protein
MRATFPAEEECEFRWSDKESTWTRQNAGFSMLKQMVYIVTTGL